jgi:hypothetical protein
MLGASIMSTIFAYSVEINGSASMGVGALEAPTTKLRHYPTFDARGLSAREIDALTKRARAVWTEERPIDWLKDNQQPGPRLRALGEWILKRSGSSVELHEIYTGLRETAAARNLVANDKVRTTKKHKADKHTSSRESCMKSECHQPCRRPASPLCRSSADRRAGSILAPRSAVTYWCHGG